MSKAQVGFILDGETEIKALQGKLNKRHIKAHIRKRNSNGISVTPDRIAAESCRLIKSVESAGAKLVFVILDKEGRAVTRASFESLITSKITASGITIPFKVIVIDQMFENWILSDIESVSSKYSRLMPAQVNNLNYEGKHPVSLLRSFWIDRSNPYNKSLHGPDFFKCIRPDVGSRFCTSLDDFLNFASSNRIILF